MENTSRIGYLAVVIASILLSSCHKILDYGPDQPPPNYRIKSIQFNAPPVPHTGIFYYNRWGNPDSVIFGWVATGTPNFYFNYNKKKQLREIKENYVNGLYEKWHRLGLNNKGQIMTDTLYVFGVQGQDPETSNYWYKRIEYYQYDKLGRIIKVITDHIHPDYDTTSFTYAYNSEGNLDNPHYIEQYDNKRNPFTLHPVWQFIQRDYSLNNPIPAAEYNSFRLPTRFNWPIENFTSRFTFFGGRALEQTEIVYEEK